MKQDLLLSEKIVDCLSDRYDDEDREETIRILFRELTDISGDSFLKTALIRLCERIEELEA